MGCAWCHGVWRAVKYKPVAGRSEGGQKESGMNGATLFSPCGVALARGEVHGTVVLRTVEM